MSAFPVLSTAASGRPFIFAAQPLLKTLGSLPKLAHVTPASRLDVRPAPEMVSSGFAALDGLTGGWPRGCLSEICGPASSGRTSVLLAALAWSTQHGEVCALVDAGDALDPASAEAAGVEMGKLLWVRCGKAVLSSRGKQMNRRNMDGLEIAAEHRGWELRLEQVLKVTDLLLQSNGFGMIVLDLGDIPVRNARQIPLASWFRFRRAIERTPTVLLVVEQQPIAGSCSSVLVKVSGKQLSAVSSQLSGNRPTHAELLDKVEITVELLRSRLERKPVQSVIAGFTSHWPRTGFKNTLRVQEGDPQGLKPAFFAALSGTAEAHALPKTDFSNQFD
jgi:recA bacterial DNA recombination protein